VTLVAAEQVVPGVHRIEKVLDWGWSNSMHVLTLADGGVLVHSPTWCGDGTFEAVEQLGPVRAILAPNHFHHVFLARFRERYPAAIVVATAQARKRLERKGHGGLRDIVELSPWLPDGARVVACEHMKTGEAWLVWPAPGGPALVVCDGFFHVTRPVRGFRGWMLRRMKIAPELSFGWTTKNLALTDASAFKAWVTGFLDEVAPRWLVPSHGAVIEDETIASRIRTLLDARLG
jgi:hypothetical protein